MPWRIIQTENRKKAGGCTLAVQRDRLLIVFPRRLFNGKQKTLSLGLVDTQNNRDIATHRLKMIQQDIDLEQFDFTLERYKPKKDIQDHIENKYPEITLLFLWSIYFKYKKPMLKESTINYYETSIAPYLKNSGIQSPYKALELREWLLVNTSESMAKRVLTYVNAAFKWGLQHNFVQGNNPYEGMPNELRHKFQEEAKPNAFTAIEKQAVLDAFANHKGNFNGYKLTGRTYQHYFNFVKFLFLTGCRPNEAVGLQWGDILGDFERVKFDGGIVQLTTGKKVRTQKSKTNKVREFPCNEELRNFLRTIKNIDSTLDSLIFPSPTGKSINYGNFSSNAWSKLVDPIKTDTTPYSCRDTFITEQILKGVNPAIIGKWCDTSTQTIEKHYFDILNLNHVLPQ